MPKVTVQTWVSTSGVIFPIQIYCQATKAEEDPGMNVFIVPLMHGRKYVSYDCLIEELQETLIERARVLRGLARGETPPFDFDETVSDLLSFFSFWLSCCAGHLYCHCVGTQAVGEMTSSGSAYPATGVA
jgi:hypothetical protein